VDGFFEPQASGKTARAWRHNLARRRMSAAVCYGWLLTLRSVPTAVRVVGEHTCFISTAVSTHERLFGCKHGRHTVTNARQLFCSSEIAGFG
jgi:hypothetical protein